MKKTSIKIVPQELINYQDSFCFLGSCFSENISEKMKEEGFQVETNPFGVLFNPLSLASIFTKSDKEIIASVFHKKGVQFSWLANSTCFGRNLKDFQQEMLTLRRTFLEKIHKAKILIVTFGSSFVYEKKDTKEIVGNCHKEDQLLFHKRMLSLEEMKEAWSEILENYLPAINPDLKLIFTISPVRYLKNGMEKDSLSKARLIELVHQLQEKYSQTYYFPSYEIMLDELRDYAYYSTDGVHPNAIAITIIWEYFKTIFFTKETLKINQEFLQMKSLFEHRILHDFSEETQSFLISREKKWSQFIQRYDYFKGFRF